MPASSQTLVDTRRRPHRKAAPDSPRACIGLGGSAGSLRAFTAFLAAAGSGNGMAYILIPHLAPDRDSMLADLLGKHTDMPVAPVNTPVRALADHVYVIAPGSDLTIRDGVLYPETGMQSEGVRTTVQRFFSALALDQGRRAVGVILSGTGSDGSEGLREIKAHGGLTLVQTPDTADHAGMPQSAVNTGMADRVLAVENMPAVLRHFVDHAYVRDEPPADARASDDDDKHGTLGAILALLATRHGQDFHHYKTGTLARRINRRMGIRQARSLEDYLEQLRDDAEETAILLAELLIGVTRFFRDADAFAALERQCLKPLLEAADGRSDPIRVWVAGCASGEEAYSIAIGLLEAAGEVARAPRLELFATDIDTRALAQARDGRYPATIAEHVSPERLARWFTPTDDGYQVKKALRERLVFAPQNLIADPPFSRMDLISCRNLLIYLTRAIQPQLLRLFHFALRPGGHLFLGNSESIGDGDGLFTASDRQWRLYQRVEGAALPVGSAGWLGHGHTTPAAASEPVIAISSAPAARASSLEKTTRDLLLGEFAPACVVVDARGEILYMRGELDAYLQVSNGRRLADLARRGLRGRLRELVASVQRESGTRQRRNARVLRNHQYHSVEISARRFVVPGFKQACVLVYLRNLRGADAQSADADADNAGRVAQLEYELHRSNAELQGTIEALEANNEELKTANEETVSINEELQSSSEELESSKEELQSLNEELHTLNAELQEKIDQVEHANTDLVNLLESTDIATIFVDRDCRIKRFTPFASRLFNLIDADVGRPIGDISHAFRRHFDLVADSQAVQSRGDTREVEEQTEDNRWFLRRMTPYRTADGTNDGAVLAFLDVTRLKRVEQRLEQSEERFRALYDDNPCLCVSLQLSGKIRSINRFGAEQLGLDAEAMVGRDFAELVEDRDAFDHDLAQCRDTPDATQHWEIALVHHEGHAIWVRFHAHRVLDEQDDPVILITGQDISAEKKLSQQAEFYATHDALTGLINRREFERRLEHAVDSAQARGHVHTLCYLDLDKFKLINDSYGHEAGDELLRQLSARISGHLRQRDVSARLGGDEFALIMEHCPIADAKAIVTKVIASIRDEEFVWHGYRLRVGCCAGLVAIDAGAGDLQQVLRAADAACFQAKELGGNSLHVHSEDDAQIAQRHNEMGWANRLRSALRQGRLVLYAQPVVYLHEAGLPGFEVLIRMHDDTDDDSNGNGDRVIEAREFMGAAVRYGLAREIDHFVLTQALDFLSRNQGRLRPFAWLAINISPTSMNHPEFLEFAVAALQRAAVDTNQLCFEITETSVISNLTQAQRFMDEIRALGCRFALDDFGTGLSSFQYLRILPADFVKIDGSFIQGVASDDADHAMVAAVHQISGKMGKTTIAECVESAAVDAGVREIGIDYGQGYYYGRPSPIAKALLSRRAGVA